jgi:hypothetical protein
MSESSRLRARLTGQEVPPKCPFCGGDDWSPSATRILLPAAAPDGSLIPGQGYPVNALLCAHCGFVRTHVSLEGEEEPGVAQQPQGDEEPEDAERPPGDAQPGQPASQ